MLYFVTHCVKILHFANEKPNIAMFLCRDAATKSYDIIMCNVQFNSKYECSYFQKTASSYRITKKGKHNDYKCIAVINFKVDFKL